MSECPECGSEDVQSLGGRLTNTGPTAVEPGYVEGFECEDCGHTYDE